MGTSVLHVDMDDDVPKDYRHGQSRPRGMPILTFEPESTAYGFLANDDGCDVIDAGQIDGL
jgi:hypothetical protein